MDTGKGIILIGEAAQSWVTLQWVQFFVITAIVLTPIVWLVLAVIYHDPNKDKK